MGIPHGLKDGSGGSRPKEEVSRQKENFDLLGLGLPSLNLVPRYAISKTKVWKAIPKESQTVGLTNNRVSQRDSLTNMTLTQTIRPLSLLKGVIVKS